MIFYDFEVFAKDWLIVAIEGVTAKNIHVIVNDSKLLESLYRTNSSKIWAGYNTNHYDKYILQGILCEFDPKDINDFIIKKNMPGWKYSSLLEQYPLLNYDIMQRGDPSLKMYEGFMGNDIKETSVPFDIDRKLTNSEIAEIVKYCTHDVRQTIEVFKRRIDDFNTVIYFIKHFNLNMTCMSKTKAQLAAEILEGNRKGKNFNDEFNFPILDCIQLKKYKYISDWYKNPVNHDYSKRQDDEVVAGVKHTFSWGGAHGARTKYSATGIFLIADVTAYYPSIQNQYHFGYRVMGRPDNFEFIHNSNIEYKRKGDKKARQPFKIMDNAISGQMKQPTSPLYDPMSNNSVCINGQLLLLDLIEHIEPYCELIQNNTDGIIVKINDYERDFYILDDIVYEWEQRTGMQMEFDTYIGTMYQKDVNNYLLIDKKTKKVKRKGAYVKQLDELNYDLPIINKALVEYMINSVPVKKTINECQKLYDFQQVTRITSKYAYILYGNEPIKEKCIRFFASTRESDSGIKKVSIRTKKPEKIALSPEHCFIFNENINDVKCPAYLDKNWYVELAKKRLKDFGVIE